MDSEIEALIGLPLRSVEKKDWTWFFSFADDANILTESKWRLISDGRVSITSEDHEHQFGLPTPVDATERVMSRTSGIAVTNASIHTTTGDLSVHFGEDIQLQFLQFSLGYDAWRAHLRGALIVCNGGGDISCFPPAQP
ncbi:MAG: hypothetical protein WDO70_05360 [Alphaproteobacteria bacterium]